MYKKALQIALVSAVLISGPVFSQQQVYPGKQIEANPRVPGTRGMIVPKGTTAERPTSPITGTIRFNTSSSTFEGYFGAWQSFDMGGGGGGGGGESMTTASFSSAGTAVPGFNFCDATTAPFTITLPTAIGAIGTIIELKKVDTTGNAVTVATTGGQTIDGSATYPITAAHQVVAVISDGSNWKIK